MYYVNLIIAQMTKKGQTIVRKTLDKTCVLLYSEVRQQTEQLFLGGMDHEKQDSRLH